MPKVSVIMPVYNTPKEYLRKAIESILEQTFENFELIIINDGSSYDVESVVNSYNDSRIVFLTQENQGISKTLNRGLSTAKGQYIARMDSDDISLPTRFEKQVEFLDKHPDISIVGTGFRVIPRGEDSYFEARPKYLDFLYQCQLAHPTVMLRKIDFEKHNLRYDEESKAEDYNLWCRAIKNLKVANLQEVLLSYRVEGQGISSQKRESMILETIKEQQKMLDYLTSDKRMQGKIIELVYKNKTTNRNLKERIFSVKNFYKFNKKYKVITVLGIELRILVKIYRSESSGR